MDADRTQYPPRRWSPVPATTRTSAPTWSRAAAAARARARRGLRRGRCRRPGCARRARARIVGIEIVPRRPPRPRAVLDEVAGRRGRGRAGRAGAGPFDTFLLLRRARAPGRPGHGAAPAASTSRRPARGCRCRCRTPATSRSCATSCSRGTFGYTEWGHRDRTHLRWFTPARHRRAGRRAGWRGHADRPYPAARSVGGLDRLTGGRSTEFLVGQWYCSRASRAPEPARRRPARTRGEPMGAAAVGASWRDRDEFDVRWSCRPNNSTTPRRLRLRAVPVRTTSGRAAGRPRGRAAAKAVGRALPRTRAALCGARTSSTPRSSATGSRCRPRGCKRELGFRLVLTVWETLPFARRLPQHAHARATGARCSARPTCSWPPPSARAAALVLEGRRAERIGVCPPGIDLERFAPRARRRAPAGGARDPVGGPAGVGEGAPGRAPRARGAAPARPSRRARLVIVGTGRRSERLRAYAARAGRRGPRRVARPVPIRRDAGAATREASCLVLASLPTLYWEEQFGMVLAEAMAAHVPVARGRRAARSRRSSAGTARCSRRATGSGSPTCWRKARSPAARRARARRRQSCCERYSQSRRRRAPARGLRACARR